MAWECLARIPPNHGRPGACAICWSARSTRASMSTDEPTPKLLGLILLATVMPLSLALRPAQVSSASPQQSRPVAAPARARMDSRPHARGQGAKFLVVFDLLCRIRNSIAVHICELLWSYLTVKLSELQF